MNGPASLFCLLRLFPCDLFPSTFFLLTAQISLQNSECTRTSKPKKGRCCTKKRQSMSQKDSFHIAGHYFWHLTFLCFSTVPSYVSNHERMFRTVDACLRLDRPQLPQHLTVPPFVLGDLTPSSPSDKPWLSQSLRSLVGDQADTVLQEMVVLENSYVIGKNRISEDRNLVAYLWFLVKKIQERRLIIFCSYCDNDPNIFHLKKMAVVETVMLDVSLCVLTLRWCNHQTSDTPTLCDWSEWSRMSLSSREQSKVSYQQRLQQSYVGVRVTGTYRFSVNVLMSCLVKEGGDVWAFCTVSVGHWRTPWLCTSTYSIPWLWEKASK